MADTSERAVDERDERRADERYLVAVRVLPGNASQLFGFRTPVARESFLAGLKEMYPEMTYATAKEN
jgi:hypothetical protein